MYFFGRETYGKCVVSFFNVVTVLRDFATTRCICCSASACVENKHKKECFCWLTLWATSRWFLTCGGGGGHHPLPSQPHRVVANGRQVDQSGFLDIFFCLLFVAVFSPLPNSRLHHHSTNNHYIERRDDVLSWAFHFSFFCSLFSFSLWQPFQLPAAWALISAYCVPEIFHVAFCSWSATTRLLRSRYCQNVWEKS